MEEFKFNIDELVYFDGILNIHLGRIVGRKIKSVGLFKRKNKNLYLVKDMDTDIYEVYEEKMWKCL